MQTPLIRQLVPTREETPLVTDRGGYTITMRECDGAEQVLEALSVEVRVTRATSRLHVGWGSFRNLDIVAARRSDTVLLLDVNNNQFRVWDAVREALQVSESASDFIEILVERLPSEPPLRQFMPDTREWLLADTRRSGSWLNGEDRKRFTHVRELFNNERVLTYCLDIRGGEGAGGDYFSEFHNRLQRAREEFAVTPDTLYVTNLPWMMQQAAGFFGETHAGRYPAGARSAGRAALKNLETLIPLFSYVITAVRLAPGSSASDLRWLTEHFTPQELLASRSWLDLYDSE